MIAILGIDPGLEGGWAIYWPETREFVVGDIPTSGESTKRRVEAGVLHATLMGHPEIAHAVVEAANAMPGQGISSTFRYGMSFGALLGVVMCRSIPHTLVVPARWKKHHGLIKASKEDDRQKALALWPHMAPVLKRKGDHGRADAMLIAAYGASEILRK